MAVKRFVAPDMSRALKLVRQEMGPDAIILSSQRTKNGVEIITSSETDLPTRGVDTRREFSERFDEELDTPLASDQAWKAQAGVEAAAKQYAQAPVSKGRGAELAREIEQARERMLAARREGTDRERSAERSFAEMEKFHQQQNNTAEMPVQDSPQKVDLQMEGLAEKVRTKLEEERRSAPADDKRLEALQNELADMRMLLERQMWRMKEGDRPVGDGAKHLSAETLKENLEQLGLPPRIVKPLLKCARPGKAISVAWREALAHLSKCLPVAANDPIASGGIYAFVGPTGVGKTTTIAKLASRYVLEHGLGKVALVTTDTYRVGAHDQLKSLGRILNVPVRVVDKEHHLPSVIASLKRFPLILIDTAGFRHGDPLLSEQDELLASCKAIKRILVLSCNSQLQSLKASVHAYARQSIAGSIITKLDESVSLGEIMGVMIEQKLKVLYTADGQSIPQDIAPASASSLVAKAVRLAKGNVADGSSVAN